MCEEEDTCVRRRISIEIIMRRRIHVIDVGDVMIFDVAKSSSFRELQPHSRTTTTFACDSFTIFNVYFMLICSTILFSLFSYMRRIHV